MIPNHLSLVPMSAECRAAMQAVAEVEKRLSRGAGTGQYAYARTFFRILNGSKRVSLRDLRFFSPSMSEQDLRGKRDAWLEAIDSLIESRGVECWLPLSASDGWRLFPQSGFQISERNRRKAELGGQKYSRQRHREACQRETAYQALAGQAEIELAFHSPDTVSSWYSRWSGSELRAIDLQEMFLRWSARWPSLETLERWALQNQTYWAVMYEVGMLTKEAAAPVKVLEKWMVPNKLMLREVI